MTDPTKTPASDKDRATKTPGTPKDYLGNDRRTLGNRPVDPNKLGAGADFPPGVSAEDAHDPGRQTPGSNKVDNRS